MKRGYRLVITSDHGEYLGEHQLVEHGRPYFYEPVTRSWNDDSKLFATRGKIVRFDLDSDPKEEQPIPADGHPAATALVEYCRALDAAFASRPSIDAELSAELKAQLEALGYIQPSE